MYCPRCGKENDDNAFRCVSCNEVIQVVPQAIPSQNMDDDPALRLVLPVGQSGLAIAAGYLGLFSLLLVPGPFAIWVSLLAFRDIKQNPQKHGAYRAWIGLVMGVLGTAGLLLVAILMLQDRK